MTCWDKRVSWGYGLVEGEGERGGGLGINFHLLITEDYLNHPKPLVCHTCAHLLPLTDLIFLEDRSTHTHTNAHSDMQGEDCISGQKSNFLATFTDANKHAALSLYTTAHTDDIPHAVGQCY